MNRPSAADRFLNRSRPTVAPRVDEISASLQSKAETPITEPEPMPSPSAPVIEEKPAKPKAAKVDFGINALEKELASLPKVVNFQLRFEEGYKAQIQKAAEKAGVTPETLLQGLWAIAQAKPGMLEEVIDEARVHHARRARAQELKPAITRAKRTIEKLGL
jgi:hypothetical protein